MMFCRRKTLAERRIFSWQNTRSRHRAKTWSEFTLPDLAREFNIDPRTLRRWLVTPALGFPRPTRVLNRLYFARAEIVAWKTRRALAHVGGGTCA